FAGPQGGKGSQGDQGAQGAQGVQGAQGPQGESGATSIPFSFEPQVVLVPSVENTGVVALWDLINLWPVTMEDGLYAFRLTILNVSGPEYCQHMSEEFSVHVSGGVLANARIFNGNPGGGSGGGINVTRPWSQAFDGTAYG